MVFIDKHSQEIYWLTRKIDFLKRLDLIVHDDPNADEALFISSKYKKVENPSDLIDRLKDIYGDDLQ
jgi:hypothetical protein